mmetsp:Transcript_8294/g.23719  ORF Transcript_8294/g.23719 Transcript_8294/m.23719 type:complete len:523 (-) Transcript_8294:135-1703(-)
MVLGMSAVPIDGMGNVVMTVMTEEVAQAHDPVARNVLLNHATGTRFALDHIAVHVQVQAALVNHLLQVGHDSCPRGIVHQRRVGRQGRVVKELLGEPQVRVLFRGLLAPDFLELFPRVGSGPGGGVAGPPRGPPDGEAPLQELPEPEVGIDLLDVDLPLQQGAQRVRGGRDQLRRGEVVRVDPDVVPADHVQLVRPVDHRRQLPELEGGEEDVVVPVLDLGEGLIHPLGVLPLERQRVRVDPHAVGGPVAAGDALHLLDQLQALAVVLVVHDRDVALVPLVVPQEVQDGVGLQVLGVLRQHAYGGGVGAALPRNPHVELLAGAAPRHHRQPPQAGDLLEHPALVAHGVPRPEQEVHRVRKGLGLVVHHHGRLRLDAVDGLVLGARHDVVPGPRRHVPDDLPGAPPHVQRVRAEPHGQQVHQAQAVHDRVVLHLDVLQGQPQGDLLVQHLVALLHGLVFLALLGLEAQHPHLHLDVVPGHHAGADAHQEERGETQGPKPHRSGGRLHAPKTVTESARSHAFGL